MSSFSPAQNDHQRIEYLIEILDAKSSYDSLLTGFNNSTTNPLIDNELVKEAVIKYRNKYLSWYVIKKELLDYFSSNYKSEEIDSLILFFSTSLGNKFSQSMSICAYIIENQKKKMLENLKEFYNIVEQTQLNEVSKIGISNKNVVGVWKFVEYKNNIINLDELNDYSKIGTNYSAYEIMELTENGQMNQDLGGVKINSTYTLNGDNFTIINENLEKKKYKLLRLDNYLMLLSEEQNGIYIYLKQK
jgi:hypothetical protein